MTHIFFSEFGNHWFMYWLVASKTPSYYLNRCLVHNYTRRNTLLWPFDRDSNIFVNEYSFENVREMSAFCLGLRVLSTKTYAIRVTEGRYLQGYYDY